MQHQAAHTMDMALITSMDVYVTKIFLVNYTLTKIDQYDVSQTA